jgi:hypothetical protein
LAPTNIDGKFEQFVHTAPAGRSLTQTSPPPAHWAFEVQEFSLIEQVPGVENDTGDEQWVNGVLEFS